MRRDCALAVLALGLGAVASCSGAGPDAADAGTRADAGAPGRAAGDAGAPVDADPALLPVGACDAGQVRCDRECIDPRVNADHCGAFGDCVAQARGARCRAPETCVAGSCELACSANEINCNGLCLNPAERECVRWRAPQPMTDTSDHETAPLQVRVDRNGNALLVWRVMGTGSRELWARYFAADREQWLPAQRVSLAPDAENEAVAGGAALSLDERGDALLVFTQLTTRGREQLWSRTFDAAAASWSPAVAVKQDPVSAADPRLWVQPAGDAVVIWRRYDEIHSTLWWNRYDAAAERWGQEASLELESSWQASAAADGAGNVFVYWIAYEGLDELLWVKRYDAAGGAWSEPASINDAQAFAVDGPRVGIDRAGNAFVVWRQFGDTEELWWNRYDSAGARWLGHERIATGVSLIDATPAPHVDAEGDVHLVWETFGARDEGIYYRRYRAASAAWQEPERLTEVGSQAHTPTAGVDDAGNVIVLWQHFVPPARDLWATRFDRVAQRWSVPRLLETRSAGDVRTPMLSVGPAGQAAALFQQLDGQRADAWVSLYR